MGDGLEHIVADDMVSEEETVGDGVGYIVEADMVSKGVAVGVGIICFSVSIIFYCI